MVGGAALTPLRRAAAVPMSVSAWRANLRDILTRSTYRGKHLYGVHDTRNWVKRQEKEWQEIEAPVIIRKPSG